MNSLKRNILDFISTFLVFAIVLSSIAIVADKGFSKGALIFDIANGSAEVFGLKLEVNKDVLDASEKLFAFNDNLFGKGFSDTLKKSAEFTLSYLQDFLKMAFAAAEMLVGLE